MVAGVKRSRRAGSSAGHARAPSGPAPPFRWPCSATGSVAPDRGDRAQAVGSRDLVDEPHLIALEDRTVDGLTELGAQHLQKRPQLVSRSSGRLPRARRTISGPRRSRPPGDAASMNPSWTRALVSLCTVERGSSTAVAISERLMPSGCPGARAAQPPPGRDLDAGGLRGVAHRRGEYITRCPVCRDGDPHREMMA